MKSLMFCSHCGDNVQFNEISRFKKPLPESSNKGWDDFDETRVLQCSNCDDYTIKLINEGYRDAMEDSEGRDILSIDDWVQLYPDNHRVSKHIPAELKNILEDLKLRYKRSPEGYVPSLRKFLEVIFKEFGNSRDKLNDKIIKAGREYNWPLEIIQMAHYIRKVGNKETHEFVRENTKGRLDLINYCLDMILDYKYIRPMRLDDISKIVDNN